MTTQNKTSFYSQTVYKGDMFEEYEKEYELSDDLPDIMRLIRVDASPCITESTPNGGVVTVKGRNNFNVLYYSSEDEKVHSIVVKEAFEHNENTKIESIEPILQSSVFCTSVNCKVLTPRKLYIKSKNKIKLDIKENIAVNTPAMDSGNDILFYQTEDFPLQTFLPPISKTFSLEEELVLDGSYPPIENIVFSSVKLIPLDLVKNIGSATLNTSAIFRVFYESPNGYVMFSRSVPLSLNVESEDINENVLIYYLLGIENQRAEKEIDNYGEDRVIRFSYSPALTLFRIKENIETLPIDVLSPTHILENKEETINAEELTGIYTRPFTVEKIFEIPDADFSEIYDTASVMDVESCEFTDQGYTINGICGISILGMTEKGIDSVSFTVNFSQSFPDLPENFNYVCTVSPVQATSMISGRNVISVRVNANGVIRQYRECKHQILTSFSHGEAREARDKSCITIYYPPKNETLWEISKHYGINPEDIAKENKSSFLQGGKLSDSTKPVFIP